MRNRTSQHRGAAPLVGFTLIELLVVISILILLVTLLMPAFQAAKNAVYNARSKTRLAELSTGAEQYAQNNRNLYPGQLYPDVLTGNGGPYTGSQVLAASLFNYRYQDIGNVNRTLESKYAPVDQDDMITVGSGNRTNSISDRFPRTPPMAVCYYPARPGVAGTDQFKEGDNTAYTSGSSWVGGNFTVYIRDNRFDSSSSAGPYNSGSYILLAAGIDGKYGTLDDVRNFED